MEILKNLGCDDSVIVDERYSVEKFGDQYCIENPYDPGFGKVCDLETLLGYLGIISSIISIDGTKLYDIRETNNCTRF